MKKIIAVLLIGISLLLMIPVAFAETLEEMSNNLTIEYPEEPGEVADIVHERLMEAFDNEMIACSFMGNMYRESDMCPGRCEGDDTDDCSKSYEYAERMHIYEDQGFPTRESRYVFAYCGLIPGQYGYGLVQWTALGRKEWLYEMAADTGRRLDDPELQSDFLIWEVTNNYKEMLEYLQSEPRMDNMVVRIASEYEKCNPNPISIGVRYAYAKYYYEQYTGEKYVLVEK